MLRLLPMFLFLPNMPSERNSRWWTLFVLAVWYFVFVGCDPVEEMTDWKAYVNITYKDPATGQIRSEKDEKGVYAKTSKIDSAYGLVVHVLTADNGHDGCTVPINTVKPGVKWIALIQRGNCRFEDKIRGAVKRRNASAVVVYNHKYEEGLITMDHKNTVSIFINKQDGERIVRLVDNGTQVMMNITVGTNHRGHPKYNDAINQTSVLFVSISFIVLMIISLAWLVFYYIQRFRYAHAKERLSKRLISAAKKAITKMPQRTIKMGDQELESDFDQCAVCIESYRQSEVIRILPCKHIFHKMCVDPWLIEQRSCPMCKMDILKAYGLQVSGCEEATAVSADMDDGSPGVFSSDSHLDITSQSLPANLSMSVPSLGIVHIQAPDSGGQQQQTQRRQEPGSSSAAACSSSSFLRISVPSPIPPQDYSSPSSSSSAAGLAAGAGPAIGGATSQPAMVQIEDSLESFRSHDSSSESNELQSLMTTSSNKPSESQRDLAASSCNT